jgi:hypothetical protein
MRINYLFVLVPAVVGVALGLVAYFAPFGTTGVDGTPGALLALIGAIATTAGAALAMAPSVCGRWLSTLHALLFVAAALTAVAASFLMQTAFAVAMAIAALGAPLALAARPRRRAA